MMQTNPEIGIDKRGPQARRWPRMILVPLTTAAAVATAIGVMHSFASHNAEGLVPLEPIVLAVSVGVVVATLLFQSEQSRKLGAVHRQAENDALTGVLNRGALTSSVTRTFAERERSQDDIGLFFIDVDSFKQVNDTHGHEVGDQYLRHIAWQISAHVRDGDLVGRMGGDEFVAILPGIDRVLMRAIADRLVEAAKEPFSCRGATIQGGISIGCHLSPVGEGPTEALDLADGAAYQAKMLGRGRVVEFTGALAKARERRERLIAALNRAVDNGDFELHYQPVFAVSDGNLSGFEALLRIALPGGAPIDPAELVPLAESTGLIVPLGAEILRRSCRLAAQWPGDLRLAVNVSPLQFRAGDLPRQVFDALNQAGIDADRLILEVTERIVTDGGDRLDEQLAELRAAGVSIAVDDFGGGAASLGHLWTHRFDQIKVDAVLLEAFTFDQPRYRPLFEVIVDLGRRLRMPVTLKGIESALHAGLVKDLGCAAYQGTWLSRPIPAAETLDLIGLTGREANTSHPRIGG